ncbi:unnamed protein product, partial [Amoebophrya sp. A120]
HHPILVKLVNLQDKCRSFGSRATHVSVCIVVQFSKGRRITNPSPHPVYSIRNSRARLEMPLIGLRITNVSVIEILYENSRVGTFFLRMSRAVWPLGLHHGRGGYGV